MATTKAATSDKINLLIVRGSFLKVLEPAPFSAGDPPRYSGTALLDPSNAAHAKMIADVKAKAKAIAVQTWGDKIPKDLKVCFGDGDDREYDGYAGMFYVSAGSPENSPPLVVDRNRLPVVNSKNPQAPYSGCYINMNITLWVQNNQYAHRINANLIAVQFVAHGEAFGRPAPVAEEEFDALEDDDGGDAPEREKSPKEKSAFD